MTSSSIQITKACRRQIFLTTPNLGTRHLMSDSESSMKDIPSISSSEIEENHTRIYTCKCLGTGLTICRTGKLSIRYEYLAAKTLLLMYFTNMTEGIYAG